MSRNILKQYPNLALVNDAKHIHYILDPDEQLFSCLEAPCLFTSSPLYCGTNNICPII